MNTETTDTTTYHVETTFPDRDDEGNPTKQDRFSGFVWTAFTPADNPDYNNYFFRDERFKHLLERPERVARESMVFTTVEAALECAAAVAQHAVLACRYEHNMDWNVRLRGMPIRTRVVRKRVQTETQIMASVG